MDKYADIRAALGAGPTPGPWTVRYDYVVQATSFDGGRLVPVAQPYGVNGDGTDLFANARMIAACHPEAIRALLAERDALREALTKAAHQAELRFNAVKEEYDKSKDPYFEGAMDSYDLIEQDIHALIPKEEV